MNFNASSAPATACLAADRPVSLGYKVDITRGERIGRVSSEWFSRPDDERYSFVVGTVCRRPRAGGPGEDTNRGESCYPGGGQPRRCRAVGADLAEPRNTGCAHPLELRPTLQPGRARRPAICAIFRLRWPGSTFSMVCCPTVPS